ncbi:hypothetical protein EVAR_76330_1 [Eumeta japonica]|uniref:Uncharacterized protein n=1 Tax=Eumeta variegata TaxID=151549 RepID=A0A4C1TAM5_EUMVA|nr:hypothetical protein EVAR_76330_1 [Eumeta japonica]
MEKIELHVIIKHLSLKNFTTERVNKDLQVTLEANAPPYFIIAPRRAQFERERTSINDDPRSGRPTTVVAKEMVASTVTRRGVFVFKRRCAGDTNHDSRHISARNGALKVGRA